MKFLLRILDEAVFPGPPDDLMALAEAVGVAAGQWPEGSDRPIPYSLAGASS